ncbi:MAG TPA: outer membrane protein assembly factor BamD [Polyangiaceae bacterium]|nr:outer membrane protein assembly factor BamD [Polyangiaceae bacterium]
MSGDPERLLSASNAEPLERELLGSVRHVGPPEGAKDIAWRNIAGQIAVVATVGAVSTSTAAAASKASAGTLATWALSTKLALVAAGGLALGGGYLALRSEAPSPSTARRAVVASVTPAVPVVAPLPKPAEVAPAPAEAPVEDAPSGHKLVPRSTDALKAESKLLTDARAQLRSGNLAGAQLSLDRLQAQFPKGMLTQEREVLAIEVAYARGNVDAAKRRAKAFVKAYPKSPHSAKLARFLD